MTQFGFGLNYSANLLQKYNINMDSLPKNSFVDTISKSFNKFSSSSFMKSFSSLSYQVNTLDRIAKQPATLLYNPPTKNIATSLISGNGFPTASSLYSPLPTTQMISGNTPYASYCNKAIGFNNSILTKINGVRSSIYSKMTSVGSSLFSKIGSSGIGQAAKGIFGSVKSFGSGLFSKIAGSAFGKAAGAIGGKLLGVAATALNFIPGIGTVASIALKILGPTLIKGVGKLVKGLVSGICNIGKKIGNFLKKL